MSHGVAGVLTLFDDEGNPVQVRLQDGEYRLVTADSRTHDALDQIILLLTQLVEKTEAKS